MSLNAELLRASFGLIVERQPQVVHRLYEILFERYPQLRPLFGGNASAKQEEMLGAAFMAVMDHLEDASWLEGNLKALGAKHVGYGVTPEMYGWVGESLLATFEESAGADWTPAHAAAWTEAYGAIATLMQRGAAEAS